MTTSSSGWIIAAAAAAAAVFILDAFIPLGIAVPMLYVIPVLLTWLVPGSRITVVITCCSVALTVLGIVVSSGEFIPAVAVDRAMAVVLQLVVAGLLLIHKESVRKLSTAQQARNESEERLRLALSAEGFGTFDWHIPGQQVRWSPETERIWGLPVGGFEGTYEHWRRMVHPDDVAEAERIARLSLENPNTSYAYDHRIIRTDGTIRWVHAKATTVRDAAGRPIRMVGVNSDITERRQMEEALRTREEQLRIFVEHAPAAIAMFDREMRYLAASRRWQEDFSLGGRQIIGRSHYEILPETPERWKAAHRRALAGEVVTEKEVCFELLNGSVQWIHWEVRPWRGHDDKVGGIVIFVEDITERKRAEAASREYEARNKFITERAGVGYWYWDIPRDRLEWSPLCKQLFGIPVDEPMSYARFLAALHPDDRATTDQAVHACLESNGLQSYDIKYRTQWQDGTVRWIQAKGSATFEEGRPVRMAGIALDITDSKQAEVLLQKNEAFIEDVLNSLSAHVCVLDRSGTIVRTNEPWKKFARANSYATSNIGAVGDNYLEVCRRSVTNGDTTAGPILAGIETVLDGRAELFSAEYSCDSPDETRWFLLRVSPLVAPQGVVLSHLDISDRKHVEEALLVKQRELQKSQAKLEELTGKLLIAQETERRRLARELHDDLTQRIATLAIDLQSIHSGKRDSEESVLTRVCQLGKLAEQITADLQKLAHQLHPSLLEHVGLEAAVHEHVEEFETRTGLMTRVQVRNLSALLSLDQATCLYRVLQESLQNVRKHANATYVVVRLFGSKWGVGLCVHDDGRGFDYRQQMSNGRMGLGLISMEERVAALRGTFRIRTNPGDGTEIHAWVPLGGVMRET
ncbi:PAS domain S-box protein [Nitrospira sp. BLG_1]|uniref:PAS domain S-box protein n=1 Tax=Nitrospira sp. BLG_1 TaxID=3395883 RepID=UPI0039BC9B00